PGDTVSARVTADKGRYLLAETAEVLAPSPDRVDAPCPFVGTCGGCQWQHISYAAQLRAKRLIVSDALTRIGGLDAACVADVVPSPLEYAYRNKVELAVTIDDAGRLVAGFTARHGSAPAPVTSCLLLPKRTRTAPKSLSGALRYLARGGELGIDRAAVRVAANTADIEVALWTHPSGFPRQAAAKVLAEAVAATGVARVIYRGTLKERTVVRTEVLSGRGFWRERVGDCEFAVSPPSFFQVNTGAAEALTAAVLDAASVDGSDRVCDLYAGVGTFTLPLAAAAGEVVAVEASSHAVRDLRRNLESARMDADVIGGDAAIEATGLGSFDVMVVDPPRTGLAPAALAAVATAATRTIVYVSCDPPTLARDAAALAQAGWTLVAAVPVDLFPQTYHTEVVARFERS
ncbi:MAG: 23S rRNA (uracil(1939)-C(5))-methyltransferase RlmD, partial [Actinobacteria bacterium]